VIGGIVERSRAHAPRALSADRLGINSLPRSKAKAGGTQSSPINITRRTPQG
jgi:hypothetical protein